MGQSGADRPIVVTRRGNARGAKGVGHSRKRGSGLGQEFGERRGEEGRLAKTGPGEKGFQAALITWIIGPTPRMAITRLRL